MLGVKVGLIALLVFLVLDAGYYFTRIYPTQITPAVNPKSGLSVSPSGTGRSFAKIDHIVVIVMENKSFSAISGNKDAGYINSLMHQYAYADNYSAVSHPSLPNYLALIGGDTYGVTSDCANCFQNSPNLADRLDEAGVTWKAYMDSMPSPCFVGSANPYAQKHNPFIYFDDIRNDPARCKNIVPLTGLINDLNSVKNAPGFIWISPNLCNDMHDCSVSTGDKWLSETVPQILNSPAMKNSRSLVVVTWDEAEGLFGNKVLTIFAGNSAKKSYKSTVAYNHYSLLRTVEDNWNLAPLTANDKKTGPMTDMIN